MPRERAERAGRLVGDDRRAAAQRRTRAGRRRPRRERRSHSVLDRLDVRGGMDEVAVARVRGQAQSGLRQTAQQRAGQELPFALGQRMRQHHLARGAQPAARDGGIERERGFDRRFGHPRLALRLQRQERVGPRMDRPGVVGEAHDPQVVELDAGRFQHAQDLHRRIRRLGLEQRLGGKPAQAPDRLGITHFPAHPVEQREAGDDFVPFLQRLVLGRIEAAALVGEAHEFQRLGDRFRPCRWRARGEQIGLAEPGQFAQALHQFGRVHAGAGGLERVEQPLQRDRELGAAAQFEIEQGAAGSLALTRGDERRADQETRAPELDLAPGEFEDQAGRLHQRITRQRRAERHVERQRVVARPRQHRGRRHHCPERAQQGLALFGEVRHDDADSCLRVGLQPRTRPGRRAPDFVARIHAGEAQHARLAPLRRADDDLRSRCLQGVEQGLLLLRPDVETVHRQQFRFAYGVAIDARRDQIGQQCRVGMPVALATQRILRAPVAKGARVLVQLGRAQAVEQAPGVRGRPRVRRKRRGLWNREQRVARIGTPDDVFPQRERLRRREQDGQSGREFGVKQVVVTAQDKRGVRQQIGGFPGAATLRSLRRVEFARERLRQALVGRDYRDAAGEPFGEMHK